MIDDAEATPRAGRNSAVARFASRVELLRKPETTNRRILSAFDTAVRAVEPERLERLSDFAATHPAATEDPLVAKYLDLPFYLKDKARWLVDLRLDRADRKSILDLGTGGGHFPFLAKMHGHDVLGIDLHVDLFARMLDVYEIPRLVHRIEPGTSLPVRDRFDLVTALQITFNRKVEADSGLEAYWTPTEWAMFMEEVCRHLQYPARIFFNFNRQPLSSGRNHGDDLLELFEANGAMVDYWKYSALLLLQEPIRFRV